jgi:ferredoxin-NADP reductase
MITNRDERAPAPASEELINVRLTTIRYAARGMNLFEFSRLDGKALPAYEPGAHLDLHLPNGLIRQYSLILAKPDPSAYSVGIKRDPASRGGSRFIHEELRVGDVIKISAPRNNFPLKEDARHAVLIAGGIGITPIWCMVQRLAERRRSWKLYYSCRSREDMAFLKALEVMAGVTFHFDDEAGGRFLDIAALIAQAPVEGHLYCCGPAPMLATFEAATVK